MSGDEKSEAAQKPADGRGRQPVFLLPAAVTALCGLLLAIQLASDLVLNQDGRSLLLTWLAFIPYRIVDPAAYLGGWTPLIWSTFTHAFLHAGWEHVGLNVVWLAVFATPVTQRYGALRMFALFLAGAAIGAWAFAIFDHEVEEYLVGASGGIAALTGAATRFIFQPPLIGIDPETGEQKFLGRRLATLGEYLRNGRARFFSLIWLVLNGLVPILPAVVGAMGMRIAWQTHIAGFVAGLLLVPLLEGRRR